jgi:hypothetical protein
MPAGGTDACGVNPGPAGVAEARLGGVPVLTLRAAHSEAAGGVGALRALFDFDDLVGD